MNISKLIEIYSKKHPKTITKFVQFHEISKKKSNLYFNVSFI